MPQHHAILVVGFNRDYMVEARRQASTLFAHGDTEVTRLTYRGTNGVLSFMVAPNGYQHEDKRSEAAAAARAAYVTWLNRRVGKVDYSIVQFPCTCAATAPHLEPEPGAVHPHDQPALDAILEVFNHVLEPIEDFTEADLDEVLVDDMEDEPITHAEYGEILGRLEQRLALKQIKAAPGGGVPFTSIRDLLHRIRLSPSMYEPARLPPEGEHHARRRRDARASGRRPSGRGRR